MPYSNLIDTVVPKTVDWFFNTLAGHPVVDFFAEHGIDYFLKGGTISPIKHAGILPYIFYFKKVKDTFQYIYIGSAVEDIASSNFRPGRKLEQVLHPERVEQRKASLNQVLITQEPIIETGSMPIVGREHIDVVFIGLPMPEDAKEDLCCFVFRTDEVLDRS